MHQQRQLLYTDALDARGRRDEVLLTNPRIDAEGAKVALGTWRKIEARGYEGRSTWKSVVCHTHRTSRLTS